MLKFKAYIWNSDIYINEKYKFDSNKILTAYLNDNHYNPLYENLKYFKRHLQVSRDMDYEDYMNYNDTVYDSMLFTDGVNRIMKKLPPYNKILDEQITRLNDILNKFRFFFEDGMTTEDYIYGQFNEDTVNEYGTGEKDERGYYSMRLFKFELLPTEHINMENDDTRLSLQELNQAISDFFDIYWVCYSLHASA